METQPHYITFMGENVVWNDFYILSGRGGGEHRLSWHDNVRFTVKTVINPFSCKECPDKCIQKYRNMSSQCYISQRAQYNNKQRYGDLQLIAVDDGFTSWPPLLSKV